MSYIMRYLPAVTESQFCNYVVLIIMTNVEDEEEKVYQAQHPSHDLSNLLVFWRTTRNLQD